MTVLAQEILSQFDCLSNADQVEVACEILKRLVNFDFPPLTDEDLALSAESLFLDLDQQEICREWLCSKARPCSVLASPVFPVLPRKKR